MSWVFIESFWKVEPMDENSTESKVRDGSALNSSDNLTGGPSDHPIGGWIEEGAHLPVVKMEDQLPGALKDPIGGDKEAEGRMEEEVRESSKDSLLLKNLQPPPYPIFLARAGLRL